jgi:hypothetical protein
MLEGRLVKRVYVNRGWRIPSNFKETLEGYDGVDDTKNTGGTTRHGRDAYGVLWSFESWIVS